MTLPKNWPTNGNLSEIAAIVQNEFFSPDQSWLHTFPDELKNRCWNCLTGDGWDEHAATILMLVNRSIWEVDRDVRAAMELKRLFEHCFQRKSALRDKISRALTSDAQQEMKSQMRRRRIPDELLDQNPMHAIEQCFFGPDESEESHLSGGLLLTGYRNVAIDSEPSGFVAVLFAIREAFAYFHAGQPAAATSSLDWAKSQFSRLEQSLDQPQSAMIGQCLSASAHAAEDAKHFDDSLSLWKEALRFLGPSGNERAECHHCIGLELERRGDKPGALRAYRAALNTPGVQDTTLIKVVKMSLSGIRAQLENNPQKMTIDADLAAEFGGSKDFSPALQQLLSRLVSGQQLPDDDLLKGISAIHEWVEWSNDQSLKDGRSLSMLVVGLKMYLSLQDQARLPVSSLDLLLQCERYVPKGDAATCLEYEMLRDHILQIAGLSTRLQFAVRKAFVRTSS